MADNSLIITVIEKGEPLAIIVNLFCVAYIWETIEAGKPRYCMMIVGQEHEHEVDENSYLRLRQAIGEGREVTLSRFQF